MLDQPKIDVWIDLDIGNDEDVLHHMAQPILALTNVTVLPDGEAEPLPVWAGRCEGFVLSE